MGTALPRQGQESIMNPPTHFCRPCGMPVDMTHEHTPLVLWIPYEAVAS